MNVQTIKVDLARAVALLREVVAEYGEEFIYDGSTAADCVYMRDGEPSCLVGHALYRAGERVFEEGMCPSLAARTVNVTSSADAVFSAAQDRQDNGATWGEALAAALARAAEYDEVGS